MIYVIEILEKRVGLHIMREYESQEMCFKLGVSNQNLKPYFVDLLLERVSGLIQFLWVRK